MHEAEIPVVVQPTGRKVYVLPGTPLVEALALAGESLAVAAGAVEMPCGGMGICGKCRVQVSRGAAPPTAAEQKLLSVADRDAGWRLACQMRITAATTLVVAAPSRAGRTHQILAQSRAEGEAAAALPPNDAPVQKVFVALPPPDRRDNTADTTRLARSLERAGAWHGSDKAAQGEQAPAAVHAVEELHIDVPLAQTVAHTLRAADFRVTAVLDDRRLLALEPGDTRGEQFAVAVDVGTTTLVASLLDLNSGREAAVAAQMNPQTRFGDDVLSRITAAMSGAEGLRQLQAAVGDELSAMIADLCRQANVPAARIYAVSFSGNTTMQHLLCGISPAGLATVPFVPVVGEALQFPASTLRLPLNPAATAYVFPVIGGFVGGDTVAGILASGLLSTPQPALLVDIGTNGEIVLAADGRLLAASTAAGPAFEGARISQGMRGSSGAIEKVRVEEGRLRINVIGNTAASGLCGSGLIDAAAELLRQQIMTAEGRLLPPGQLPDALGDDLRRRVLDGRQPSFLLADADEAASQRPIVLTQRDLRELQLATGAIRAGIALLLREAGVAAHELKSVLIAGGFGNFIRRSNAQRIGLLPPEVDRRRILYKGNTSLAGAQLVALSRAARDEAAAIARRAEHLDLSTLPGFQEVFADAMIFPEREHFETGAA